MSKKIICLILLLALTACNSEQTNTPSLPGLSPEPYPTATIAPTQTSQVLTIVAASCSREDVQQALDVAPDGGVVFIPAGECDWGGEPAVTRAAGTYLKGAGKDKTIIMRSAPVIPLPYDGKPCVADLYYDAQGALRLNECEGNPPPEHFLIMFDCANGKHVEVSDLTLVGNDDFQNEAQRLIDEDNGLALINGCVDFKVHDAAFNKFSDAGLVVKGGGRGVIYKNEFLSNFKCQDENTLISQEDKTNWKITEPLACLGYGISVYGDALWNETLELGSQNAIFIEDNYFFDNRHAVASNLGSHYVVRYNDIAHSERARNFGIVDAHGHGEYGVGSRSWEVYHNVLMDKTTTQWNTTGILLRGGDGVIFDNVVPSTFAWGFALTTEKTCSAADYPMENQTRFAYAWGNHAPDSNALTEPTLPFEIYEPECLQEGRDFFIQEMPGYKPYVYPHPLREISLFE